MDFNNFPCSNLIAKCDLSSWFNSHYSSCNKLAYENDKMNNRYIYIYMYIWYEPVFQNEGRGFIVSYLFRTVKVASLYATNLTKHIRYCCNLHLVILVMASSEHNSFGKLTTILLSRIYYLILFEMMVLQSGCLGRTKSMPWLLIPWLLESPGNQQPLHVIDYASLRKTDNYFNYFYLVLSMSSWCW